jgi:hypothetical protein
MKTFRSWDMIRRQLAGVVSQLHEMPLKIG